MKLFQAAVTGYNSLEAEKNYPLNLPAKILYEVDFWD